MRSATMTNTMAVVINGFAPGGPSDLLGLGAHFLQELKWTYLRHGFSPSITRLGLSRAIVRPPSVTGIRAAEPLVYRFAAWLGLRLAGVEGLEPPTPGFGDRCSSH